MTLSSVAALLSRSTMLARVARATLGGLLGLSVLGWVVEHGGPSTGQAVVHVVEADVEVTIGGNTYRIQGRRYEPLDCELPVGRHELVMRRGGRVLCGQSFELRRGESLVLTAWDPERLRAGSGSRQAPASFGAESEPDLTAV